MFKFTLDYYLFYKNMPRSSKWPWSWQPMIFWQCSNCHHLREVERLEENWHVPDFDNLVSDMRVYNSVAALNSTAGMEIKSTISAVYTNPLRDNSLDFILLSNHSLSFPLSSVQKWEEFCDGTLSVTTSSFGGLSQLCLYTRTEFDSPSLPLALAVFEIEGLGGGGMPEGGGGTRGRGGYSTQKRGTWKIE